MNEVLDGTNSYGPNYGAGAVPGNLNHVNADHIPQPARTLLFGERFARVESVSIGTMDRDRHRDKNVNLLFVDTHVTSYHGKKGDTISSGSSAPNDYWMTHDGEIVWGTFR